MLNNKQILDFIDDICDDLNITTPGLEFVDELNTPTQLAAFDVENNKIYLKKDMQNQLDQLFAIAHELRHAYQIQIGKLDLDKYSGDKSDIVAYNMQEEELDANAYAGYIMIMKCGVKPQFSGMDNKVKKEIFTRIEEFLGI